MDPFFNYAHAPTSSATKAVDITPNDTTDLDVIPRAIYATESGNIAVILMGDTESVTLPIVAGMPLAIRPKRILLTGTTASGIVAVW